MSTGRRAFTSTINGKVTVPALLLILPCFLGGCSDPAGLNGHDFRSVARMASRPAWSRDGRTIFYTDRSGAGVTTVRVKALNTSTGGSRELASVAALNHGEQVRTTNNTSLLYVAIAQPNWSLQLNLYSVPASGGGVQTIVTNLGTPWFVASRDGSRVAYQGSRYDSDTIYVASTSEQSDRVRIPSTGRLPRVISISPNGSQLIYSSSTGLYLTRADGSGQSQLISESSTGVPPSMAPPVLWSGDVPHVLVAEQQADSVSLLDLDGVSGNKSRLSTLPKFLGQLAFFWQLARSEDGGTFAVWLPIDVVDYNVEGSTYRYRLYVKRPADPRPVAAFEVTSDEPATWFEFSQDSRRIALLVRGSLYLVNVD